MPFCSARFPYLLGLADFSQVDMLSVWCKSVSFEAGKIPDSPKLVSSNRLRESSAYGDARHSPGPVKPQQAAAHFHLLRRSYGK